MQDRWCAFATELDAYLVYYHLLGSADPQVQRVTEETCRAMSVQPGDTVPTDCIMCTPSPVSFS